MISNQRCKSRSTDCVEDLQWCPHALNTRIYEQTVLCRQGADSFRVSLLRLLTVKQGKGRKIETEVKDRSTYADIRIKQQYSGCSTHYSQNELPNRWTVVDWEMGKLRMERISRRAAMFAWNLVVRIQKLHHHYLNSTQTWRVRWSQANSIQGN